MVLRQSPAGRTYVDADGEVFRTRLRARAQAGAGSFSQPRTIATERLFGLQTLGLAPFILGQSKHNNVQTK